MANPRPDPSRRRTSDLSRTRDAVPDRRAEAEERQTLQERISDWLDIPLAILALLWAILVAVELAAPLPPAFSERIFQVDFAIWLIFALVFLVEFTLAPRKLHYLRTHFLAALSLVLPFVRVVRIIRVARILRSVSLARLVLVANRATGGAADLFSRQRFQYVLSLVAVTSLLGAAGVYYFERGVPGSSFQSFGQALWWSTTMATTINIGAEPVTVEGRVIGLLLRVLALAVFGYVTASIASFLVDQRVVEREQPRIREEHRATAQLLREIRQLRADLEQARRHSQPEDKP